MSTPVEELVACAADSDPFSKEIAMQHQPLTPAQKEGIKKREERRRRERERRAEEYRRRIERLRRQVEEARKRRQRMWLMLLLAVLAMQESILAAFQRSFVDWPNPDPEPKDWTPDPRNDFAAQPGHDDHCDGYSRKEWTRMLDERGIKLSRKAEMKAAWEADPDHELFPLRYRNWGYRPFLGEVMNDLSEPRYQPDALKGLKLLSPPETHQYLDEVYAINPLDLLHCRAELTADIINNFRRRVNDLLPSEPCSVSRGPRPPTALRLASPTFIATRG